jgi:hypothetical protein
MTAFSQTQNTQKTTQTISANKALWAGILFSLIFIGIIWLLNPLLANIKLLPDQGSSWYYWKLPQATFWSRFTAWAGYTLHQVVIWALIYYAQKSKLKYSNNLHRANILSLAANAFFILLHLLQTHLWYDGLAQDTPIWSSQWSVIILLVAVLLMENQRRGLFFGKKISFLKETGSVLRHYHGYLFAWGTIYTFWFHPTVSTPGHLVGFLYTFFLMLQGSLMFTRLHVNRYWMFVQEITVLFHGTMVALITNTHWPMFFFGFAGLFIVTQMHGIGLKRWHKWGFVMAYIIGVVITYSIRGWAEVHEILRIPIGEYALVFVMALLIWLGMRLTSWLTGLSKPEKTSSVSAD